jgi:hypothetical protein
LVLFKPLCDSHRGPELLDNLPLSVHPRVVWAYRDVDGRTKSALAKFGDANLRVLSEIATGRGLARWQAQRLSTETLEFIRSFDYSKMTPATASALFWYARNMLLFELKLAGRPDVFVSSYDALVEDPATTITALCDFLGFPYRPQLHAHIAVRSAPSGAPAELSIDPRVRERCAEITTRLEAAAAASRARAQAA